MVDPDGVCALAMVDNSNFEVAVGDRDAFTVVAVVVVCRNVVLVRTGTVVFHW